MTREEKINLLNVLLEIEEKNDTGNLTRAERGEFQQWVKALEQEPTTNNDLGVDCISRAEVIDYLCKHCPDDGECFKDCDEIKHLREMPSVTFQEHILDKIRAEVEKLQKMCDKNDLNLMAQYSAFGMVLDIIDKYKAESENKE